MKRIKILATIIGNPKKILSLGYMAFMRKKNEIDYAKYNREKYNLVQLPTLDILDLIPDYRGTVLNFTFLNATSMPTIILMLKLLAKRFDQCSFLEIGSMRGENISNVSDNAKDCTSLTLSKDEMRSLGFLEGCIKMDGMFSKDKPNITSYTHNSLTFDFSSLNKKFDLISIDADNTYNSILQDTKNVFKLLKSERSIIVWHNYATDLENDRVRQDILAGILDGAPKEYHNNIYHVSNTICAIFVRGEFPTSFIKFPSYPSKVFNMTIEAKKL